MDMDVVEQKKECRGRGSKEKEVTHSPVDSCHLRTWSWVMCFVRVAVGCLYVCVSPCVCVMFVYVLLDL